VDDKTRMHVPVVEGVQVLNSIQKCIQGTPLPSGLRATTPAVKSELHKEQWWLT
jgi:hypothetical protein